MANKSSLTDVQTLRKQARQHIEEGAVTSLAAEETHAEEGADLLDDLPSRKS